MGGKERVARLDLLSNDVNVVRRLQLEIAVVGPKVNRDANAGYASFVDLSIPQHDSPEV